MLRNLIILPDGTEVFSGAEGAAVMSVELTESVNTGTELTLGSACAAMAEITLLGVEPGRVTAGDELTLYTVDDAGNRQKLGLYTAEKPVRKGAGLLGITAYDRVSRLDRDLTRWLAGLVGWPYSLSELAQAVCAECGLTLKSAELPNGGYAVQKFSADGVTGRQLMQWIGQVAGRFCRATAEGEIELAWYAPASVSLGPSPIYAAQAGFQNGELTLQVADARITDAVSIESALLALEDDGAGNVTLTLSDQLTRQFYFQGSLSLGDYAVAPVEKVQLRQNEEDVGTVYPDTAAEGNTYIINGNPLLSAATGDALLPVAQTLYEQLRQVTYTPCTLELPAQPQLAAGTTATLTDSGGNTVTVYIMTRTRSGQSQKLECTGSARRDSSTAGNNQSYAALSGKVLNLRTDVDGIKAENADTAGKVAALELDLGGIRGQVSSQTAELGNVTQQLTTLEQSARDIKLSVQTLQTDGASKIKTAMGYTFDDSGLHIAREGQQMENLLDETGMHVTHSGKTILQANDEGVIATDVKVRNYLIVGTHARFEDYPAGRTACFWLEG